MERVKGYWRELGVWVQVSVAVILVAGGAVLGWVRTVEHLNDQVAALRAGRVADQRQLQHLEQVVHQSREELQYLRGAQEATRELLRCQEVGS